MRTAIVLSGGGARGDFEVGVLHYLYYVKKIRPDIICGTSVGSINGIKLAEGEGAPDQGLQGLTTQFLAARTNDNMYQMEPWLARVDARVKRTLLEQASLSSTSQPNPLLWLFGPQGWFGNIIQEILLCKGLCEAVQAFSQARSLFNLDPVKWRLRGNAEKGIARQLDLEKVHRWAQSGNHQLRLAVVSLETGVLRYVTETGEVLERDNRTPVLVPESMPAPEVRARSDKLADLQEQQRQVRQALSAANTSYEIATLAAQARQLNRDIGRERQAMDAAIASGPHKPLVVDLVDATLASSAIPGFFPAVKLGNETYVDGGVREILPVQAALDLGAEVVYGVLAPKLGADPAGPFDRASLAAVADRSLEYIMVDEIALNDTFPPRGWGSKDRVVVIAPLSNLHDIMTIDPGLISISMAYGYMRAGDVIDGCHENPEKNAELADVIANLRTEIWRLECAANGHSVPHVTLGLPDPPLQPQPEKLPLVRQKKRELRALIESRRRFGGALPADSDTWWQTWERHPWQPLTPSPWDPSEFQEAAPAESVPPPATDSHPDSP